MRRQCCASPIGAITTQAAVRIAKAQKTRVRHPRRDDFQKFELVCAEAVDRSNGSHGD